MHLRCSSKCVLDYSRPTVRLQSLSIYLESKYLDNPCPAAHVQDRQRYLYVVRIFMSDFVVDHAFPFSLLLFHI